MTDGRDPVACGNSVVFDGLYVCRLGPLPCKWVKRCPETETNQVHREEDNK